MIENMVRCTGQSRETLLSATFYPIAVNLGRNPHPQAISRFLKGSIAGHLRYCPRCLEKDPYYRLPWRFVSLTVCPVHACLLQEKCAACGKSLPLMPPGFQITICPSCGQALSDAPAQLAEDPNDLHASQSFFSELDGLMSISPVLPEMEQRAAAIGSMLKRVRQELGSSLTDASIRTGIGVSTLSELEADRLSEGRGTFRQLRAYTSLLNITTNQLLTSDSLQEQPRPANAQDRQKVDQNRCGIKPKTKIRPINRVEDLPTKIEEAIDALHQARRPITRRNVCKHIGIKGVIAHGNPEVIALLKKIQEEGARQARQFFLEEENSLLPVARQAIVEVIESEGHLYIPALCKVLGLSLKRIRRYPKIARLIDLQKIKERSRRKPVIPEDVVRTIEDLKAAHQTPSQVSVANALKVSPSLLKKKPELRRVLVSYGLVSQPTRSNAQNSITA